MKFAQYLHDTQTPEWKKAYIDYRGLKKRIAVIRKSQQGLNFHVLSSDESPDEAPSPPNAPRGSDVDEDEDEDGNSDSVEEGVNKKVLPHDMRPILDDLQSDDHANSRPGSPPPLSSNAIHDHKSLFGKGRPSLHGNSIAESGSRRGRNPFHRSPTRRPSAFAVLPLHELLQQLSPQEASFFILLDAQLDKVESFYLAREKEMLARDHLLKVQLKELQDHRKLFHEAQSKTSWANEMITAIKSLVGIHRSSPVAVTFGNQTSPEPQNREHSQASSSGVATSQTLISVGKAKEYVSHQINDTSEDGSPTANREHNYIDKSKDVEQDHEDSDRPHLPLSADPDTYLHAKRKLKKAVLEHYRGLEMLHNYRVLNITGFRKALKKFEKVTNIPVQHQYMTQKVDKSAFASDKAIKEMMTDMELMYAAAFVRGDRKTATRRLRAGNSLKSHHFSAFHAGVFVGIALPALVEGLVKVFQRQTREAIPAWGALLYVYGIILIPTLFALLVGVNLLVWANARINYVFIFELDVLTQLDYRQYFEIPSFLFASLCYAFWLSFSRIGNPHFSPTLWPVIWLVVVVITLFNPLPIMHLPSRYWLIKNVSKLLVSGTRPVEFTDFWMGDQFCSLVFTLSNLYFFVCVYANGFAPNWHQCGTTSSSWFYYFLLASLPLFIRTVQSIKRYWDSGLLIHLTNGGKYASGIVGSLFYFMWRKNQNERGTIFALYCLFNVCYSIYASSWDFLMDWSILRLHMKHPLLRQELLYTNHVFVYYFAIVSNLLIRFIWVLYIPKRGPNMMVRTFIAGFLEMLRRLQWNFYRLENEHLGNMDQYRVTREVPLPYAFNDRSREDDSDDEHHLKVKR